MSCHRLQYPKTFYTPARNPQHWELINTEDDLENQMNHKAKTFKHSHPRKTNEKGRKNARNLAREIFSKKGKPKSSNQLLYPVRALKRTLLQTKNIITYIGFVWFTDQQIICISSVIEYKMLVKICNMKVRDRNFPK